MTLHHFSRHALLTTLIVIVTMPAWSRAADAQAAELSPEGRKAAEAGLKGLAGQQLESGAFAFQKDKPHTGVTAIAGLAMLSAGSTPDEGEYKANVRKAIDFILT